MTHLKIDSVAEQFYMIKSLMPNLHLESYSACNSNVCRISKQNKSWSV